MMMFSGALIGDLAAWTYEHDQECFNEKLVSPEAKLSAIGLCIKTELPFFCDGGNYYKHRFYTKLSYAFNNPNPGTYEDHLNLEPWSYDYNGPRIGIPFKMKQAMITAAFILSGNETEERQKHLDWVSFFHGGKQEHYAQALMPIIRRLKEGQSKDEIEKDYPVTLNYYKSGSGHHWHDYLEYITFAWRCFYFSHNFNEAIINAAKCPRDRHLTMALAGAFAEAYYGHDSISPEFITICDRLLGHSE